MRHHSHAGRTDPERAARPPMQAREAAVLTGERGARTFVCCRARAVDAPTCMRGPGVRKRRPNFVTPSPEELSKRCVTESDQVRTPLKSCNPLGELLFSCLRASNAAAVLWELCPVKLLGWRRYQQSRHQRVSKVAAKAAAKSSSTFSSVSGRRWP